MLKITILLLAIIVISFIPFSFADGIPTTPTINLYPQASYIFSQNPLVLSGTADPNIDINIKVSSYRLDHTTTTDNNGDWSITILIMQINEKKWASSLICVYAINDFDVKSKSACIGAVYDPDLKEDVIIDERNDDTTIDELSKEVGSFAQDDIDLHCINSYAYVEYNILKQTKGTKCEEHILESQYTGEVILDELREEDYDNIITIEISNEQINQETGLVSFVFPLKQADFPNTNIEGEYLGFYIRSDYDQRYGFFTALNGEWEVEIPKEYIGKPIILRFVLFDSDTVNIINSESGEIIIQLVLIDEEPQDKTISATFSIVRTGAGFGSTDDPTCNTNETLVEGVCVENDPPPVLNLRETIQANIHVVFTPTIILPEIIEEQKKTGSSCNDCTPPTLGVNSDGKRMVDNGIKINGETIQVDYFYTEMPMQYTELGKNNTVSLKFYENGGTHNVQHVNFALGVNDVGSPISESQAIFEIGIGYFKDDIENPKLGEISIEDDDGIIGDNYDITLDLVSCIDGIDDCLLVEITYNYAKVPDSPILAVNAWDYNRVTINHYFNDGLTVIDPNPPPVDEPIEKQEWECTDPIQNNMNRNNCNFRALTSLWDY